MIYSSFALVLSVASISASAALPPFSRVHLHPHDVAPDTRISLTLHNGTRDFRSVKVAGHSYDLLHNQTMTIKAPVGTVIYADSRTPTYHRGDAMFEVSPQADHTRIELN